jgi:hypothetical protein
MQGDIGRQKMAKTADDSLETGSEARGYLLHSGHRDQVPLNVMILERPAAQCLFLMVADDLPSGEEAAQVALYAQTSCYGLQMTLEHQGKADDSPETLG